ARGLVALAEPGDELPDPGISPSVPEHHEPDQPALVIVPKQVLTEEVTRELLLDRVEILVEVQESPHLSDLCLVEDLGHVPNEVVFVRGLTHLDSLFLGLPDEIPGLGLDLLGPPMVEAGHWKGSDALPLRVEIEAGLSFGKALPEAEDV